MGALLMMVKDIIIKGPTASAYNFPCRDNCLVEGREWECAGRGVEGWVGGVCKPPWP